MCVCVLLGVVGALVACNVVMRRLSLHSYEFISLPSVRWRHVVAVVVRLRRCGQILCGVVVAPLSLAQLQFACSF